jgi:DNA polymerase-1
MIVIVDGNHLASRCYFSSVKKGGLCTSYAKEVGLIYYLLNTFKAYYNRFTGKRNPFIVVWDSIGKTTKHAIFPEYKTGRKKFPEEYYQQIEDVINILNILDIAQFRVPEIEADDIVGTLALQARKLGNKVMIISGDHDFEQIISNSVSILASSPVGETIKDKEYVRKKYGIEAHEVFDMMCLTGCATDGIPGIPKVASVTAVKLLKAAGGLENVIKNIDTLKVSERIKNNVKSNWNLVELNKQLVKIDCHLNNVQIEIHKRKPDFDKLKAAFEKLEFNRFLESFEKWKQSFEV